MPPPPPKCWENGYASYIYIEQQCFSLRVFLFLYLFMCMNIYLHVCIMYTCAWGQKRSEGSDPLELELLTVSHHVVSGPILGNSLQEQ